MERPSKNLHHSHYKRTSHHGLSRLSDPEDSLLMEKVKVDLMGLDRARRGNVLDNSKDILIDVQMQGGRGRRDHCRDN